MMKSKLLILMLLAGFLFAQGQQLKTFSGVFLGGKATYTYYEDASGRRIYDGSFCFEGQNVGGYGYGFRANGTYRKDRKSGNWIYTALADGMEVVRLKVGYRNGKMEGDYLLSRKRTDGVENIRLRMRNNRIVGKVGYKSEKEGMITGQFDENGFPDGVWTCRKTSDNEYTTTQLYRRGCLIYSRGRNESTGDTGEADLRDVNAVDAERFFAAYDSVENVAEVDGKYYRLDTVVDMDEDLPLWTFYPAVIRRLVTDDLATRCRPDKFKGGVAYGGVPYLRIVPDKKRSDEAERRRREAEAPVDNSVYMVVEQLPVYPGGMGALMRFLGENLRYPTVSAELGEQGTVVLQFVVTKTGDVGEVKVVRSVSKYLDAEAIRVCKLLKFTPGMQGGKPVNVWYSIPFAFNLD